MWKQFWNWIMDKSYKCLQVCARKSLHGYTWTIRGDIHENTEKEQSFKERYNLLRHYPSARAQNARQKS